MDKSRINQQNQKYSIGKGQANVNLYNGRLLFEYPLVTIGNGNYQISTSISYNSHYASTDFSDKKIGLGNGWKLNFHQYLFPYKEEYNLDEFVEGDYLYIDSNWYIHRFVLFYNEGSTYKYYDTSGTGLRVIVEDGTILMYDEANNKYYFDKENGYLTYFTSGVNSNIKKVLEYDSNNNLISIYDERKDRKINFIYNSDGMLVEVNNTLSGIGNTLEYNGDLLLSISKYSVLTETTKKKKEIELLYYNSDISYIINSSDIMALNFTYSVVNEEGLNNIISVKYGQMVREIVTEEVSEAYVGDDVYVGDNFYVTNKALKFKNYNWSMPEANIKSKTTYSYPTSYTEVENENGIKIRYYFNSDGDVISELEYVLNDGFYSLKKTTGTELYSDGTSVLSNVKIDGANAKILNQSNNYSCTLNASSFDINSLEYKLSFWLRTTNTNDLVAKVEYKTSSNDELITHGVERVLLHDVSGETWQHVSTSLKMNEGEQSFDLLKIYFENYSDNNILLSNVKIEETPRSEIVFYNDTFTDTLGATSYIYYKKVGDASNTYKQISNSFYMTSNDIFNTYKSLYYKNELGKDYFELVYNNGTKVILVTEAGHATGGFNQYNQFIGDLITFEIDNDTNTNYYIKSVNYLDFNTLAVSKVKRKVEKIDGEYYYVSEQISKSIATHLYTGQRITEDDEDVYISYSRQNVKGTDQLEKSIRYVKVVNETLTEEEKVEESIVTQTVYDSYGNILRIEVFHKEDTSTTPEVVKTSYIYSDNDESERENIYSISENGITCTYTYDDFGNVICINDEKGKTQYVYDPYYEVINNIDLLKKDYTKAFTHNTHYLPNGNIRTIKSSFGEMYNFRYNKYAELNKVYRDNKLVEESEYNYGHNLTSSTSKYKTYQKDDVTYLDTYTYDKYHRQISYNNSKIEKDENGEEIITSLNEVTYEYDNENDRNLSPYAKRISKITDGFSNKVYDISYSDKGNVTDTTVKVDGEIEVTSNNTNELQYTIKEEQPVYQYISKDLSNGNVTKTLYLNKNNKEVNEKDFSYYYSSDKHNRVNKKLSKNINTDESKKKTGNCLDKTIVYKTGSNIPAQFDYNLYNLYVNGNNQMEKRVNLNYSNYYTIDNKNISYIIEEKRVYLNGVEQELYANKSASFDYDDFNRLISEETESYFINYLYDENSGMLKTVIKDNVVIKTFTYNNTILTKVNDNDIMYDRYGNIISIGNIEITYNSRGLMESYTFVNEEGTKVKYNYYYNYQGIRYKKERYEYIDNKYVLKETINYYLNGSTILGEDIITYNGSEGETNKLRYYYDYEGICGIKYNNKNYVLIKDTLGNISKVLCNGELIGEYIYDAWGNHEIELYTTLIDGKYVINNNPFRYRGYYYDEGSSLYYCQARYYSPELCRFISPDSIEYLDPESVNGLNLYCYCLNNPII